MVKLEELREAENVVSIIPNITENTRNEMESEFQIQIQKNDFLHFSIIKVNNFFISIYI